MATLKSIEELGPRGRAKRSQILAAARQLFLEQGFERTSMEAIRLAAAVSKPTLYQHYAGKEGLFADVLATIVHELAGRWLTAAELGELAVDSPPALRATLMILAQRILTSFMQPEYLALVRIVVAELPRFPQLGQIYRAAGPDRGLRTIATLLEAARMHRTAQITDMDAAARLFLGPILSYALIDGLLETNHHHNPTPAQLEALVDLFLKAIS
jgi:AcrR family transcriptional regulator